MATDDPIHLTHKNVTSKILEIYIQRQQGRNPCV